MRHPVQFGNYTICIGKPQYVFSCLCNKKISSGNPPRSHKLIFWILESLNYFVFISDWWIGIENDSQCISIYSQTDLHLCGKWLIHPVVMSLKVTDHWRPNWNHVHWYVFPMSGKFHKNSCSICDKIWMCNLEYTNELVRAVWWCNCESMEWKCHTVQLGSGQTTSDVRLWLLLSATDKYFIIKITKTQYVGR